MITIQMIRDRWNRDKVYTQPQFWDDAAEKYYRDTGTNIWVNPHINELMHRQESGILLGWLDGENLEGLNILDIGCGAGRFSREFAKRGATVTAFDFSPKSIEIAKRLTDDPKVSYHVGSVFDLQAKEEYDIVVCSKVLTIACRDVSELRHCLKRIVDALKPGGRYLSTEMCHSTFVRRVLKMTFRRFQRELEAAGFSILDTKVAQFIPFRLALAFFEFPRWLTVMGYRTGEVFVKLLPIMSDQKFTFARKKE